MKLRGCESADSGRLTALFQAQGFQYQLPDLRSFAATVALEDEGEIQQAVLARPTVELYFLAANDWKSPGMRFEGLRKIHEAMRRELNSKGFEDAHVWLPPEIAKSFGRRLMKDFGWTQPMWTDFTRSTSPKEIR